ncbi:SOUL family heme-binding protein [Methylosoma difficile]
MKNPITILVSLFLTGCTVMGIRSSEEAPYSLLSESGNIQIRLYPPVLVAETLIESSYAESGSIGFKRLAGYIFGGNVQKQQMAMTSPVLREAASETIAMTAPVLQQKKGNQWVMTFVMSSIYTLDTLPKPLDDQVIIKQMPAKKVAVLRYSGSLNQERIAEKSQVLLAWLAQNHFKQLSESRSAAYDPPWTLPFLRRNEVHVDVE